MASGLIGPGVAHVLIVIFSSDVNVMLVGYSFDIQVGS